MAVLSLGACDTSVEEQKGFLSEPGPILLLCAVNDTSQLFSMNPDGSDVRQLTNDTELPFYGNAAWSPDGRKIAMVLKEGGSGPYTRSGIYIINADGTNRYRLVGTNNQIMNVNHASWSPDSKQIAFTAQLPPEGLGLFKPFVINADGTGFLPIGKLRDPVPKRVNDWSSDGKSFLGYTINNLLKTPKGEGVMNGMVVIFNVDGAITDTLLETSGAPDYETPYSYPAAPLWSHDGRWLAFANTIVQGRPGAEQQDIYVADASGKGGIALTHGEYDDIYPIAWSPDDKMILSRASRDVLNRRSSIDPMFTSHIVLVQADGSGMKEIVPRPGSSCWPLSWRD